MTNCILVYVNVPTADLAKNLAKLALEQKIVACVNIFPTHLAMYEWENELKYETEVSVIFKTTKERYSDLEHFIKNNHPFDTPCILSWDINQGNHDFVQWIQSSVS